MNKKDMFIREKLQKDKEISDRANKIFDNIKEEFKVNNNEKKVITISLNKFLAIAACLIIVGFVGINIYANSLGKPNIISGIEALIKDEPEVNVDDIAKELFEKGAYEIRYLEHSSLKEDYEIVEPLVRKEINGKSYFKTKEKYEKVEQKYGEIFTEEALENILAMRFADVNGVLYVSEGGATGTGTANIEVEKLSEENGELTYRAFYNDVAVTGDVREEKYSCEFKIKEVNGEYRISATNYCNIDKIKEKNEDNVINDNIENKEAKRIIQSYLNIYGNKQRSPILALMTEEIGLVDTNFKPSDEYYVDEQNYRSTNIEYEKFEDKMLQYMTQELLKEISVNGYKNVNGMLYIFDGGASGITFDVQKVGLISENGDIIKYEIEGIVNYPGQEYIFKGKAQLQKNVNGKYVVSELEWREENINLDNNEKTETINGADSMPEMLKYRNKEYKANYYYRLVALKNNNDGTYTATVNFYSPIFMSEENYKNIVEKGKGEVDGILYEFSNKDNETNIGYGYIYNDNETYTIEKQEGGPGVGYALYCKTGGIVKMREILANSFEMTLNENLIVKQSATEGSFSLKEYANFLTKDFIDSSMITFEYSEENGEIYLFSEIRL